MTKLLHQVLDWFRPSRPLRRYRVAPRQHPVLFRRRLLQAIAHDLRKTGLVVSPRRVQYSDTAL
jgi:hypothetical protein